MSEIVGFLGMSHSPFATLLPPKDRHAPGGQFLADVGRVRRAVTELAPDALVIIGPDHFHANFYDVMPPFVLGVEEAVGFGDYGSTAGPVPVASELAWAIRDGLTDAAFDLSLSYSLTIDHGVVQSYDMLLPSPDETGVPASRESVENRGIPTVPIVVNTAAPPLPSLDRCVALGHALGQAVRASSFPGRVLIVASGGLSHWLPTNDPRDPQLEGAKRASLIHGRQDARAFAAAREPKVRAMGGDPTARVNTDWDAWFLEQLETGDLAPVAALGHEGVERQAGSGGQEIRTWLIGHAAVGQPLVWTSYDPVPEWITGMGIGTTFPITEG